MRLVVGPNRDFFQFGKPGKPGKLGKPGKPVKHSFSMSVGQSASG